MRWLVLVVLGMANVAAADPCTAQLDARKVSWKPASRPGITHPVEITGPLGGISYKSYDQPLVIDCSLAISLDEAGRYIHGLGFDKALFSSAYSRRNVRAPPSRRSTATASRSMSTRSRPSTTRYGSIAITNKGSVTRSTASASR